MFKTSPDPRVGSPTGTIIAGVLFLLFGLWIELFARSGRGAFTHLPSPVLGAIAIACGVGLIIGGIRNRPKV